MNAALEPGVFYGVTEIGEEISLLKQLVGLIALGQDDVTWLFYSHISSGSHTDGFKDPVSGTQIQQGPLTL